MSKYSNLKNDLICGGLRTKGYFKKSFNDEPLVSVITVVFNNKEHLEQTIQSVVNQTYDNVEYIIVDGGSTDGTLSIIKKYEESIDYWVSEPDKGLYDAMNKGLDLANGDWINYMNSGDAFYESNTIQRIINSEYKDADLIYGNHIVEYDFGFSRIVKPKDLKQLWKGMVFSHQSLFAKKEVLRQNKFKIKNSVADYGFILDCFTGGRKFYYINSVISKISSDGISDTHRVKFIITTWATSMLYYHNVRIHLHYIYLLLSQLVTSFIKKLLPKEKLIRWKYSGIKHADRE
jgi:glycosyltransferase involved in cell wall biosynthesis